MRPDTPAERGTTVEKYIQASTLGIQAASSEYFVEQYQNVRRFSEHLCEPLVTEDYVIQSMPDVSPTKWHLAHVSWFFEKPADMGEMPLGRADIWHGLNDVIFGDQRFAQVLRKAANVLVLLYEILT